MTVYCKASAQSRTADTPWVFSCQANSALAIKA